jgi:hypothetical protein
MVYISKRFVGDFDKFYDNIKKVIKDFSSDKDFIDYIGDLQYSFDNSTMD